MVFCKLCNLRKLCNQFVFAIILILGKQTNKKTIVSPNYMNWDINHEKYSLHTEIVWAVRIKTTPPSDSHTHTRAQARTFSENSARASLVSLALSACGETGALDLKEWCDLVLLFFKRNQHFERRHDSERTEPSYRSEQFPCTRETRRTRSDGFLSSALARKHRCVSVTCRTFIIYRRVRDF